MATFDGQLYKGEDMPPERAHVQIEDGRCRLFTDRRRLGSWDLTRNSGRAGRSSEVPCDRWRVRRSLSSQTIPPASRTRSGPRSTCARPRAASDWPIGSGPPPAATEPAPIRPVPPHRTLVVRIAEHEIWRGFTALAAVGIGTLAVEAAYAVLRKVPVPGRVRCQRQPRARPTANPCSWWSFWATPRAPAPGVADPSEIWCRLVAARIADRGSPGHHPVLCRRRSDQLPVRCRQQVPEAEALDADLTLIAVGTNDVIHQVPLLDAARGTWTRSSGGMTRVSNRVLVAGIGDLGTVPRLLPPLRQLASRRGGGPMPCRPGSPSATGRSKPISGVPPPKPFEPIPRSFRPTCSIRPPPDTGSGRMRPGKLSSRT